MRWRQRSIGMSIVAAFFCAVASVASAQSGKNVSELPPQELFSLFAIVGETYNVCLDSDPHNISDKEKVFMHHESVTAGLLVEHIMNKSPGTSEDDALERVVSFKKRVQSKLESDIEKIGGCQGRRVQSMLALFEKLSDIRFGPVIAEIAKRHGLGLRK